MEEKKTKNEQNISLKAGRKYNNVNELIYKRVQIISSIGEIVE
jgi:hypothetical protein